MNPPLNWANFWIMNDGEREGAAYRYIVHAAAFRMGRFPEPTVELQRALGNQPRAHFEMWKSLAINAGAQSELQGAIK